MRREPTEVECLESAPESFNRIIARGALMFNAALCDSTLYFRLSRALQAPCCMGKSARIATAPPSEAASIQQLIQLHKKTAAQKNSISPRSTLALMCPFAIRSSQLCTLFLPCSFA